MNENQQRGMKLAGELEWDGADILEVAATALEEANFHIEAAQVRAMLEEVIKTIND